MNYARSSGFSLIETALVVLLLGFVAAAMAPTLALLGPANKKGTNEIQQTINSKIAQGYVEYVRSGSRLAWMSVGIPIIPYTEACPSCVNYAVVNPGNPDISWTTLRDTMLAQGVSAGVLRSDGSAAENVRVSQIVALTHTLPVFGNTGPNVTLTYNYGVVYSTQCPIADATCNPGAVPPSSSPTMLDSNYATWAPSGTDFSPATWSTLGLQREKLNQTSARLDKLREAFKAYFKTKQAAVSDAATATTTNYYPNSQVAADNTTATAAPVADRQYCWDGWYNLADGSSSNPAAGNGILNKIGLTPEEFGVTSWGGRVEYCRDYDPTGSKGRGVAPFWGAIRVLGGVSTAGVPNTSTSPATADGANALLAF